MSALIALVGILITQVNQQQLDQKAQLNSELQSYLSTVGELPSNLDPAADTAAQAQTLTVLPHPLPEQKRTVIQFLYHAGLINKDNPRIGLFYADLTSADLTSADLKGSNAQDVKFVLDNANLRGVNLTDADLGSDSMKGVNLHPALLANTNLSNADLSDADLAHAGLPNADLSGATLSGADLSGTDLQTAKGLTQEQIDEVIGNERTLLPDDLQRPANWS